MIAFSFIDTESCDGRHPAPIGYEDIIVVVGQVSVLTPSLVGPSVGALVNFEGGPFRVRMDGFGAPVAGTSGYLRSSGDEYFCSREEAKRLVVVFETGATNGNLRVTYYG